MCSTILKARMDGWFHRRWEGGAGWEGRTDPTHPLLITNPPLASTHDRPSDGRKGGEGVVVELNRRIAILRRPARRRRLGQPRA
jgi:hypothetical protein